MKLQSYELSKLGQQLVDFHDDIQDLINNGKFQFPLVTTVPTYASNNGELVLRETGATRELYARFSSAWVLMAGGPSAPVRTVFTTTAVSVASNSTAELTLLTGLVGTTSLIANTFSEGRTLRLQAWGYYNTPGVADALTMRVKIGGTVVLTTSAQTPASSVSTGGWHLNGFITCQTTGGAGTVFAQGEFPHQSTATLEVNWQMVNSSTIVLNTTGANIVEVTAQWGGASAASQLFLTNCAGELLN